MQLTESTAIGRAPTGGAAAAIRTDEGKPMKFGEELRRLRRDAKMTQRQSATAAGVNISYICKAESDRNPSPSADTIVRMCEVLGVRPESLLALTGKIPSSVIETLSVNAAAQEFLRETHRLGLGDNDWRHLSREVRRMREEGA